MKIKNRQQLLALLAMAGVALFAADKLVFSPLTRLWQDRSKQIAQLRNQVAAGSNLLKREPALRATWQHMRADTLTNNASLAQQQVRRALDRWSQDSKVSITSINPQWKHDADDFMTLEYRLEAAGNLSALTKFLFDIEKEPMALRLETVELSTKDNDGQQLSLGLQLSALVLTPPEQRP
jgi:hypothetical protein